MERRRTREVRIGTVKIGGDNPVAIQSMCNTDTRNVDATVAQILALEEAGCEIVRVAIPDMIAAEAVGAIKERIHIPLVADIHFDYRLALKVMDLGIDKVRINPGNYVDPARTFKSLSYTPQEYEQELNKIKERFTKFLAIKFIS